MASPRELEALTEIWQGGGKGGRRVHHRFVATRMGISDEYVYSLCEGLEKKQYLKMDRAGFCRLTREGREYLEEREHAAPLPEAPSHKASPPEGQPVASITPTSLACALRRFLSTRSTRGRERTRDPVKQLTSRLKRESRRLLVKIPFLRTRML